MVKPDKYKSNIWGTVRAANVTKRSWINLISNAWFCNNGQQNAAAIKTKNVGKMSAASFNFLVEPVKYIFIWFHHLD